jgi:isocitrate/isopropylmalate dehydrogenase
MAVLSISEKGVANSVATVWNGAELLRWFGESKAVVRTMTVWSECAQQVLGRKATEEVRAPKR